MQNSINNDMLTQRTATTRRRAGRVRRLLRGTLPERVLAVFPTAAILLTALMLKPPAYGQGWDNPMDSDQQWRRESAPDTARRKPGLFSRARQETAAAELADAERRIARGRRRSGVRRYRAVVANWPDSEEAVVAQKRLAAVLAGGGRHTGAFNEYQYLITHYSGRFPYEAVLEAQLDAIRAVLIRGGRPRWKRSDRVLPMLERILENAPQWEKVSEAQALIAEIHERNRDYEQAAAAYAGLQRRHPRTAAAVRADFREVRCMTRLSGKYPNDEALAEETLAMLRRYLATAPEAPEKERALRYARAIELRLIGFLRERAEFYERRQKRPGAALIVYRDWLARFPDGPEADHARQRIQVLQSKPARQ